MMFQQRHYEAVAHTFAEEYWTLVNLMVKNAEDHYLDAWPRNFERRELIARFAKMFQSDNPRFNEDKFNIASRKYDIL